MRYRVRGRTESVGRRERVTSSTNRLVYFVEDEGNRETPPKDERLTHNARMPARWECVCGAARAVRC